MVESNEKVVIQNRKEVNSENQAMDRKPTQEIVKALQLVNEIIADIDSHLVLENTQREAFDR